jgi:hypothetical protein
VALVIEPISRVLAAAVAPTVAKLFKAPHDKALGLFNSGLGANLGLLIIPGCLGLSPENQGSGVTVWARAAGDTWGGGEHMVVLLLVVVVAVWM